MKNITLFVILLAACRLGYSQSKDLKMAHKLYANKAYTEAIEAYTAEAEQTPLDTLATKNLAESYYYTQNAAKAVETYARLWELKPDQDKAVIFRYADAAKRSKDYAKANELLTSYTGEEVNILQGIEDLDEEVEQFFFPEILDAASAYNDFGAAYYDRQIIFASDRNAARPVYPWTGRPYLDLYYANVNGSAITDDGLFPGMINTDTHESNAVFSADGRKMYFTRTSDDFTRINDAKIAVLQIYSAELVNGQWGNITLLPINSKQYSVAHPALSPDGKSLYFSSDMPGGFGSFDIYKVNLNEDGSFATPVNLGNRINSDKLEQFPFISDAGNLYFASNRAEGLGGLDLYRSKVSGETFADAYNLGSSINSNADDFALIMKENEGTGYFSSNRTEKDKLYRFETLPNINYQIIGNVDNKKTLEPIPGAKVTLFRPETGTLITEVTDEEGSFKFDVRPNSFYKVKASKELYVPIEKDVRIEYSRNTKTALRLYMEAYADTEEIVVVNDRNQLTQINLEKIYFDFDKSNIRPDAATTLDKLVAILTKYPEMKVEIASHTDMRGSDTYNQQLSERRAQSTRDYVISKGIDADRLTAKGYGESDPINNCTEMDCTDAQQDENRRSEFTIIN
ncbi:OmpA family protein [Leeuwenhoekiella parthenopeia]|uniref:OmpA family protein n=1 Tax=Leeuwenhoekiella parthenopeia TaxID=2890320 RepID=A0ABS8GX62_9FLAO|nr:OmpA family protein [Leeuwenhoekiella parthenopeia]MCC4213158.1 OmpA family protein [Leeuwenhoekiella parthenopeia]